MTHSPAAIVDTHCHLNLAAFKPDLDAVLERASDAGITKILVPGMDLASSQQAISLANEHPALYAAVGVHPHDAKKWSSSTREQLEKLARDPKVVAIGEIGLDFYRNYSDPEIQRQAFKKQLELASDLQLPVIIHNREAGHDILPILEDWSASLPTPLIGRAGVLHAFSSDGESASKVIEQGFYLGIAGPITFRNAESLRELVGKVPLERLLTETDAPYLTPEPYRGKRNEPGYVRYVATEIASICQVESERVHEQTSANALKLFQWNHETTNSYIL
ncbi:MAG: TatD family hydrolase [Anaerolineales bacterium]|jgi:TatD DNase family protein